MPSWHQAIWVAGTAIAAIAVALLAHWIVFAVLRRFARQTRNIIDDSLISHTSNPTRLIAPLFALLFVLPRFNLPEDALVTIKHLISLGMIGAVGWLSMGLLDVVGDVIADKYKIDQQDNLRARRIHTQAYMLRRVAVVVVSLITLAIMLMTFPSIRHLGISLFASAGIAGIVVGMAARPTLSNILAGIQIALTEPFKLDDVVIVEGEWGRIEEIGTTYVVVRIWDLRRLVLPINYFIENPFENWTRKTADLLGTVFLYTDYTVPVEELRQELHRILEASDLWDGKVWTLQVTNGTEQSLELRALMSAADSSAAWNLRCHVREKLIGFLQEKHPQSLPRARVELKQVPAGDEERTTAAHNDTKEDSNDRETHRAGYRRQQGVGV